MALSLEKQIEESIGKSQQALITFRRDWTVDAVASALALAHLLEARGKKVDLVADGFVPTKHVAFLPGVKRVVPQFGRLRKFVISLDVSKTPLDELTYNIEDGRLNIQLTPKNGQFQPADLLSRAADYKYDLIFTVGTPDLGSLGQLFTDQSELFYKCPIINIDHDAQNENYGQVNLVDITATSTAEIIHRLLVHDGHNVLTEDMATTLLAGIIAATRSFRAATMTPQTLDVAAQLVTAGARHDEIVQNLFKTRSIATLKLWGRVLARLKYDPEIKTVWSLIVRQDFVHSGANEDCLSEVMAELMVTAPEAEIAGLIYENDEPKENDAAAASTGVRAMLTSEHHTDVLKLVRDLQPEGHRRLAKINFPASNIQTAEQALMNSLRKSLGKPKSVERTEI